MAALRSVYLKFGLEGNSTRLSFLQRQSFIFNNVRFNHMFRYLQNETKHDTKYKYEVSKDPKEWEYVEKLLPMETVPEPKEKPSYPSGWRPQSEEALKQPYFVERSKNHMLSVYLKNYDRGQKKWTQIKRIEGDLWRLHDELKTHIEEQVGKKIASFVNEGSKIVTFKGDYVYYAEQWLLSKGF